MALTEEQKNLCAEWVSSPNRKWQTLNRGQWNYEFHEKTLVRYVEEAMMDEDLVAMLLEYLSSEDCKSSLQLYGQEVSSEWMPLRAWYETTSKAVSGVRAVRLYHALSTNHDAGADGPYTVENGCAYKVEYEFHWKEPSVVPLPASSSGVQYRIANLNRDDETGLFSYVVEKRTRVLQEVRTYTQAKTIYGTRKEAQYIGVKEGESAGVSASASNGTVVERVVTKNADCTHDVRNVTRTDFAVSDAVVTKDASAFEVRTVKEDRNQASAAPVNILPGQAVRNEKTDSGRYNRTTTSVEETPVESAVVEITRDVRGTRKSVTDRNQPAVLSDKNLKIGERRTSRMTDGGNFDNTTTIPTEATTGDIAKTHKKTIYEESESVTRVVTASSGLPAVSVANPVGGVVLRKEAVLRDDGTADKTETKVTETPVESATEEIRRTARGTVKTTTHRNQTTSLVATTPTPEVGVTVASRKTDGNLFDNTITEEVSDKVGTLSSSQFDSATMSQTSITNETDAPAYGNGGGVNYTSRVTSTRNQFGTWDVTNEDTVYYPISGGGASASGLDESTETVIEQNSTDGSTSVSAARNKVVSVSAQPNGHGSFTRTQSTTTYKPSSCKATYSTLTEKVTVETKTNNLSSTVQAPSPGRASIHPNSHGSYTHSITTIEPKEVDTGWIEWEMKQYTETKIYYYDCGIRIFKNLKAPPKMIGHPPVELQISINDYGLFDGCFSYKKLTGWDKRGRY